MPGRHDFGALGVHAPPIDLSSTYPVPDLDEAVTALDALAAGAAGGGEPRLRAPLQPDRAAPRGGARRARGHRGLRRVRVRHGRADGLPAGRLQRAAPRRRAAAALRRHRPPARLRPARDRRHLGRRPADVAAAIRPDTGLVLLETPQNPTLGLVDIAAVVAAAGDVPVLVDNTFATPVLQNPARHGAALTLHSATKFLGGHGDVVAGAVACDAELGRPAAPGPDPHRRAAPPAGRVPAPPQPADAAVPGARGAGARAGARRAARRPPGRRAGALPRGRRRRSSAGPAPCSPSRSSAAGRRPRP